MIVPMLSSLNFFNILASTPLQTDAFRGHSVRRCGTFKLDDVHVSSRRKFDGAVFAMYLSNMWLGRCLRRFLLLVYLGPVD